MPKNRRVWAFLSLFACIFVVGTALVAPVALADVSGSYAVLIDAIPQTNTTEFEPFFFDLRSRLVLNLLVSGLNTQLDTIFGFTGVEYAVATLSATLGALHVTSTTAFAVPFANLSISSFTHIVPIGPFLFVTHRVKMEVAIAGVLISNLTIYEDVNFHHPFSTLPLGPLGAPVLPSYTLQSQAYGFGDIVTVQGQTPSGITIAMATGFNADPNLSKTIKNRGFSGAVTDPGASLNFLTETITITSIPIAFTKTSVRAIFRYNAPARFVISSELPVNNFGTLNIALESPSGAAFPIGVTSASFTSRGIFPMTVVFSFNSSLALTSISLNTTMLLDTFASLNFAAIIVPGTGLKSFSLALSVTPAAGLSLSARVNAGPGLPLTFSASIHAQLSTAFKLAVNATFSEAPSTTQFNFAFTYSF